jgi:hypothetical protein
MESLGLDKNSDLDLKMEGCGLDPKMMEDCGLDPKMMEDCGLDPKMMEDCGLDPKKTMDFALFQDVCFQFLVPEENHESVARFVSRMQSGDIKRPPPLSVILYRGRRNFYAFLFGLIYRGLRSILVVLYLIREIHVILLFSVLSLFRR